MEISISPQRAVFSALCGARAAYSGLGSRPPRGSGGGGPRCRPGGCMLVFPRRVWTIRGKQHRTTPLGRRLPPPARGAPRRRLLRLVRDGARARPGRPAAHGRGPQRVHARLDRRPLRRPGRACGQRDARRAGRALRRRGSSRRPSAAAAGELEAAALPVSAPVALPRASAPPPERERFLPKYTFDSFVIGSLEPLRPCGRAGRRRGARRRPTTRC